MIFGRKQEWRDNNINIMYYVYCTYVHRGHGHVRPELTDKARRGGRIIKKNNNNNNYNGASTELEGG